MAAAVMLFGGLGTALAGDWPQWRGVHRDGHAEAPGSPIVLPSEMKAVWKLSTGPGFSGPVVVGSQVVYLDEKEGQEWVHVGKAVDGTETWAKPFAPSFGDEWGTGPRSTPFVDGDRLYVQSCRGQFQCFSLGDGTRRWGVDFEKDFGVVFVGNKALEGAAPRRGNNGSGVIDGANVVLAVGSPSGASLVAFDKLTGKVAWKSQNDEAAYSSLVTATLAGVPQVIAFTADALIGVRSLDGALLWRFPVKTAAKRHALTPVVLDGDRVFVASHSYGAVCVQIQRKGDQLEASAAWSLKDLKINLATPTAVGGFIYGLGGGSEFVCIDAATGSTRWSQPGFGRGAKTDHTSTLALGKQLLVLNEAGQIFVLQADPERYQGQAPVQVCGKTWSHPAYASGRLYVRDGRQLMCFALQP